MPPSYYIYSSESLPNPEMMGKAGYTPDSEWIGYAGFRMGVLPKNAWVKMPDKDRQLHHTSWLDRKGTTTVLYIDEIVNHIRNKPIFLGDQQVTLESRGVFIVDHEPTGEEKVRLEKESKEANLAFRMKCVEWFENQVREKEVTGHGRTRPTPYENECYEILGLTKPYSVEAMRAQRHPGEAVGEQIVAALDRLEQRRNAEKPEKAAKVI